MTLALSDAVWVALFVMISGLFTTATPIILARMNWRRQDEVAHKVAEVAVVAIRSQEKVENKLEVIHTLVNSNLTESKEAELAATIRELALMRIVAQGEGVDAEAANDAIASTEARIAELTHQLADRKANQDIADQMGDTP